MAGAKACLDSAGGCEGFRLRRSTTGHQTTVAICEPLLAVGPVQSFCRTPFVSWKRTHNVARPGLMCCDAVSFPCADNDAVGLVLPWLIFAVADRLVFASTNHIALNLMDQPESPRNRSLPDQNTYTCSSGPVTACISSHSKQAVCSKGSSVKQSWQSWPLIGTSGQMLYKSTPSISSTHSQLAILCSAAVLPSSKCNRNFCLLRQIIPRFGSTFSYSMVTALSRQWPSIANQLCQS